MSEERTMIVSKIERGTVIDKIPAGKSLQLIYMLHITGDEMKTVAVGIHVNSASMGKKDILKLTNRDLSGAELNKIWLIAPDAVISTIKDYQVSDKRPISSMRSGNEFEGVLKCNNPTCATNFNEPVKNKFILMDRDPLLVRCYYCDRVMIEDNIKDQLGM